LFALIILDFIYSNRFKQVLEVAFFAYVAVLSVYVSKKEFARWYNCESRKHMGQYFVVAWTGLIIGILLLDIILNKIYDCHHQ